MAKTTGLGAGLLVGGTDVSGSIGAVQRIASPRTVLDLTDITQSAPERALALKDGGIDFTAWFEPDVVHPVLAALPREDVAVTYLHRRTTQGSMAASMVGKQVTYDANRQQDGSYVFTSSAVSNAYGLEWGEVLSEGIQTRTTTGNTTSLDDGAATSFGFQAYLHVLAFTGTNVTFTIQSSSDDGAGDAFAAVTGGAFVAATDVGWQRIQTARDASIERYLRVAVTGTFSSVTFAVIIVRNPVEVIF
jgi:hypothetical protein